VIEHIIEDLGDGIMRVNLDPERWYEFDGKYYPSVTWILDYYPKDIGFHIWLTKLKDWDEGRQILHKAGDRGSRVHAGIEKLLRNEPLHFEDVMPGHLEPFTPEDWHYLLSFQNFFDDYPLTVLNLEETVLNAHPPFGGTADFRGEILLDEYVDEKKAIILDWKTSSAIYPTYYMQVSAYAKALGYTNAGIVRLGTKSKRGYEFKFWGEEEIEKYYNLFWNIYAIWQSQNEGAEPRWKEFKSTITLRGEDDTQNDEKKDNSGRKGEDQDRDEGAIEDGEGNPEIPGLL
jgi:hypothetical protein